MGAISGLNDALARRPAPFLGPGSVAVTKIECETPNLNAVPSTATLYVDRRITEGEKLEDVLDEIRALPEVRAAGAEVELLTYERTAYTGNTFGQEKYYPSWATDPSHPAIEAGLNAGEDALGRRPKVGKWVFSTNGVASMGKLGIPTIGFGPSNEIYAHTVADQCPVEDLVAAIAWYAAFPRRLVAELAGTPPPNEA
jgi:putative selenium metabolism hydrolase